MVTAFQDRYPGTCACGRRISPGDQVAYLDDELVHLECVSQRLYQGDRPQLDAREVCDQCWTTKATNGTCACDPD